MFKNRIVHRCVLTTSLGSLPAACLAGAAKDKAAPSVEKPASRNSGDVGVSVISQSISCGLVLNNQGPISQDYPDLSHTLYESKSGFLNKVQFNLGIPPA